MSLRLACADVGKVSYLLRLAGDKFPESELRAFDQVQRDGVGFTLDGDVGDDAWAQATTQIVMGGLGLRTAEALALPAFISSRVAARSAAQLIFADMEAAGLTAPGLLMQQYDTRLEDATQRLISTNPARQKNVRGRFLMD